MSPASGPVHEPKMVPAATMEDQDAILEGKVEPIVLGAPPYSSPDPATDARKMLPLEDGTSAYEAREEVVGKYDTTDYKSMKADELKALVAERDLTPDSNKKDDLVAALTADDAEGMKASDFKDRIAAATTQEELDAVGEFYTNSGRSYSSVENAMEARQKELDEAENANS